MDYHTQSWETIHSLDQLNQMIERSRVKPVLFFKHDATSPSSQEKKIELKDNWALGTEELDVFLIDSSQSAELAMHISDLAGVLDENPQVVLFADGVTMYDESMEMISFKKIKLALKIVNRTFRWMETRA